MSKNQVRLLSALLFSAILHAVIFSAIYMDSRDPENMAKKNIEVKKSEEVNEVNTVMLTTSVINQKAEKNKETNLDTNVDDEVVKQANEDTSNNLGQDNVETITSSTKLPVDIIKTNNDTTTSSQNNTGGQVQVKSTQHPALLNNEKFLQNNEVAEDEKRLRAEIEQINTQLSLAINEVKNRNQQHINQIRQQNLYVDVYED